MDLSPRHELEDDREQLRKGMLRSRTTVITLVVVLLVIAGGFVMIQGLRNATLFFRNVDEAIEQRADLGDRRFRLQGRVVPATVRTEGGVTLFEVVHNCEVASVQHTTDPPELFESPWIPVVLEGKWSEGSTDTLIGDDTHFFLSDRMLVKHTNEYAADYGDRVSEAPPEGFLDGCENGIDEAVESASAAEPDSQ